MLNPLHESLHGVKLADITSHKDLVTLSAKGSVEEAVKVFNDKGILSAPVMEGEDVLGMVDVLDIAAFIMSVAPDEMDRTKEEIERLERAAAFRTLREVMDYSGRDPYLPIHGESPATEAVTFFTLGAHRVTLVDHSGKAQATVSQSDVLRNLAAHLHMGKLKPVGERTLKSLMLGQGGVVSVHGSTPLIDAMAKLKREGVSALAVVDESGKLIGNLSGRDIARLFKSGFHMVLHTVQDFLAKESSASLHPTSCTLDSTLLDTVRTMAQKKLHRMWVVDGGKATGVVSATDIMILANAAEIPFQ